MADLTLNIISNMSGATAQVNEFTNAMKRATSAVSSTGAAVKKTGSAVSTAAAHVAKLGHSANKTAGFFGKLNKSLARIAVYRAMRKAISYVGEAFKTGLEAAYQFSKANQPAEYAKLAGAMDGIKKAASTMSLQLGAAFGGLITAVAPVLIQIINLVTAAADAITRFFAVLNGTGYYKKAAEGFEEVGKSAGGAGKKIKGLLASWDELNVIGKESGGGGGGSSATDYSGAYEWVKAESEWAKLFKGGDFFGIGEKVSKALNGVLKAFDKWLGKVRKLNLGKKLAKIVNGFFSNKDTFKTAGETLADALVVVIEIVADFLENIDWQTIKNAFITFAKSFYKKLNEELGNPKNFGKLSFKPYWKIVWEEFWGADKNNVNADGSLKKWYAGIKEDFERMWEDTKQGWDDFIHILFNPDTSNNDTTFLENLFKPLQEWAEGIGESLADFGKTVDKWYDGFVRGIKDKITLVVSWLKDLPTKAKNIGIKIINALAQPIISGINSIIEKYNDSFLATLLGKIDPISFELIPEIPKEELTRNYDNAKKLIEARNATDAIKLKFQAQVEKKIEFKELFENFFPSSSNKAKVEVAPEVKNPVGTSKIFGANSGVTSGGGKTNLTLGIIPSLGDRSNLTNGMNKYVVRKDNPWSSFVNPKYNTGKSFFDTLKEKITGKIFGAKVDPKYNSGKLFFEKFKEKITGKTFDAKTSPKYGSDKTFFSTFDEKITGKTYSTIVNPKLSVPQKYKNDMGDLTETKTVDIKPKLTDAKAFKEQLQSALKASASIKTTVSGTTKTIGKVSMSEYAQGGWPNIGDLFIANEAGPELVGTIGGNTAVANNNDIVQGIQGGVERANSEQNELIRQQNSILMQLLNKELTISPSVALGQVMARSTALYGRA